MKKLVIGLAVLIGAWMWSRGVKDPREWPKRLPKEIAALWDDLDDAFAAGRRAAVREEKAFDEELVRVRNGHA
jgi:hypothetical protein